jgi:hypothetical protein
MTYNEIIKQALAHLEYRTDEDAVAEFFDRFIMYANEATRIIADSIKMTECVDVIIAEGEQPSFNIAFLEVDGDKHVTKICDVYDKETKHPYKFFSGNEYGEFVVAAKPGTDITVRYRYMPVDTTDGDAKPGIPEIFHPILWMYIVYCHNNSRSSNTNYNAQIWLAEFERQLKIIRRAYGTFEAYRWKNLPWQTREM